VVRPQEIGISKNHMAIQILARDLLTRAPGERIPTALQYQQLTGVGSGTIQKALRTLQHVGAVQLQPRGHVGTFVLDAGLSKLWALAAVEPPTAVLPLPTSPELMGLAMALRTEFKRLGIPLQTVYTYGSSRRVELVESGEADFTAVSEAAAASVSAGRDEWLASSLQPTNYYYEGSWVVIVRHGLDPFDSGSLRRIGIDRNSHDQTILTEEEFPPIKGREYVDGHYSYMTEKVATGTLDAMVWHKSALTIPLDAAGISSRPLERPSSLQMAVQMSSVTLLTRSSRTELARVFELLDRESLHRVQAKVATEEILPFY
jgi:hypothetical protein